MKAKRTLSLMLAVAMIISLLPTVTFSAGAIAGEEPHSIDYVFASDAFTAEIADYTDIPKITDRTLNREVSTGYWEYVTRRSMGFEIYSGGARNSMSNKNAKPGEFAVALKITVDKPGEYIPTLNYHPMLFSGLLDSYIVETSYTSKPTSTFFDQASLEKLIADAGVENSGVYEAVSVDAWAASGKDTDPTVPVRGKAISLEAKDYYLVFILSQGAVETTHPKGTTYAYIHSFNLTEKGNVSMSAASDAETVKVGKTVKVTGTLLEGETPIDGTVTYSSSNDSIATVDAASGVVTGVSAGEVKITASATVGGEAVSDYVEISVLELESNPKYVFSSVGAGVEKNSSVDLVTSYVNTAKTTSTGEWMHYANISLYSSKILYEGYLSFSANTLAPVEGERSMVLKLCVDESGKYKPELVFDKNTSGSYFSAYLVPVTYADNKTWTMKTNADLKAVIEDAKAADGKSIKLVAAQVHTDADTSDDFFANEIELDSGEYYLVLNIGTGKVASAGKRTFLNVHSLELTPIVEKEIVKNPQFVFNKNAVNDGTTVLFNVTSPGQIDRSVSTGLWYFLARPGLHSASGLYDTNSAFATTDDYLSAGKNGLVLHMEIDETAIYTPSVTFSKGSANGLFDMYLVPKTYAQEKSWNMTTYSGLENAVADANNTDTKVAHLFSEDAYDGATSEVTKTGTPVSLSAGEYYFVTTISEGKEHTKAGNGRTYAYISNLSLTQFEPYMKVNDDKIGLEIGESFDLIAELMTGATAADDAVITYASSDKDVAEVDANGKITATGVGNAVITASTNYGGKDYSVEANVTVYAYDPGNGGVVREFILGTRVMTAEAKAAAEAEENDGDSDRGLTAGGTLYGFSFMDELSEIDLTKTAEWMWSRLGSTSFTMGRDSLSYTCRRNYYGTNAPESYPVLKINVPNKGEYNLYMNISRGTIGTGADIYAVDVNDVDNIDREYINSLKGSEIGRVDGDGTGLTGYIKVASCNFPHAGDYYLILDLNTENETVNESNNKQSLTIKEMKLSAAPRDFAKVEMSLEGLEKDEPVALRSVRDINVKLTDEYGIEIDEFAPGEEPEITITADPAVAEITEDGKLDTCGCGEATITATVKYKGDTKTGTYDILVTPTGRNLMDSHNVDFESDEWIWNLERQDEAPEGKWWQRAHIGVVPTEDDPDNRALGITFNPEYSVEDVHGTGATPPTLGFIYGDNGKRVKVKPGKFYYMSFKLKLEDIVTPEGYAKMDIGVSVYPYTSQATGTSYKIGYDRNTSFSAEVDYTKKYSEWVTVTLPVSAPFESDLEEVYLTPIFVFRPNSAGRKVPGYSGTVWVDDFEIREVGFSDVEIEIDGALDTGVANDVTVYAKPRTANGLYISIGNGIVENAFKFSTSDERVLGKIDDIARVARTEGSGLYVAGMTATPGGMNGESILNTSMTLNGITRTGTLTAVASHFKKELLYIEVNADSVAIGEGNTTQINTVGTMTDGTPADLSAAQIIYDSQTPDIVSVDENGVVTPIRAGTGKVLVTAILDGAVKSAVVEISVVDTSDLIELTLTGPETVGHLRDEPISLTGVMESTFGADIDSMDVEWVINCDTPGGVSVIDNKYVFGDVLGAVAEIYAVVTHNGKTVESNKITVTVTEADLRDYVLEFGATEKDDYRDLNVYEDGWEVIEEKSSGNHRTIMKREYVHVRSTGINQPYAVKINVPYTGVYNLIFTGAAYGNYSAENADIYVDDVFVGDYSFYNRGASTINPAETFRTVYLTAGLHEIIFNPTKTIDVGSKGAYMAPAKIRFVAKTELPGISKIKTASESYALIVGETADIGTVLVTADGFEYSWQKKYTGENDPMAQVVYRSGNEDVVKVSEDGVITAIAEGNTTVEVEITSNGATEVKEIPVTVDGSAVDTAYIVTDRRNFYVGESVELEISAKLASGRELSSALMTVEWSADPAGIVSFDGDKMTAVSTGNTTITGSVTYYGGTIPVTADITVLPDTFGAVKIVGESFVMRPGTDGEVLTVKAETYAGKSVDMTGATILWESSDDSVAAVDANGNVEPVAIGTADITATVTIDGVTVSGTVTVSVREGKTERTYYTDEKVEAALENIGKYDWAKSTKDNAVKTAEKYLELDLEDIWKIVPADTLPRSLEVGMKNDPERYFCRYCGVNFEEATGGSYSWMTNALQNPWKIQCSQCKRLFPSNDFAKLYELGLDEHGEYNVELAHERNAELVAETGGEVDYLKNTLYPELSGFRGKLTGNETAELWGVDDGLGYNTGRTYSNGVREVHTYIAVYMHWGVWYSTSNNHAGIVQRAANTLADAYLYTGDKKYGRLGAVLIDRLADVYPGYDIEGWIKKGYNNGATNYGKTMNYVWDTTTAKEFARAYDAFFPMYDDPEVVSFLSSQAEKYKLDNKKETPEAIRQNIEDGVLREIYEGVKTLEIHGNFGMHQAALATAAVVLDTQPETNEMIDFVFRTAGADVGRQKSGGDVNIQLVNEVSRDGQGTESAPGYNRIWLTQLVDLANDLAGYDGYDGVDVWSNPKYVTMFRSYNPLTMVHRGLPPIGDSGGVGIFNALPDNVDALLSALKNTNDPVKGHEESAKEIAQIIYRIHGGESGDLSALHYDIFTKNPESVQDVIENVIETYGPYPYDKSSILTGYGFAALRDGALYKSISPNAIRDTTHDFSIYFGGAKSHCHHDTLNLSLNAYGISMSSDLGYPEATGHDPNRAQWNSPTISHNTVVVNEVNQLKSIEPAKPLHFDAKDTRVKVMDVDAPNIYPEADEYRRTLVMINYDDEISYGVDFFKVLGGDDHLYSFHASTEYDATHSDNLSFYVQPAGSYAGIDVPFGEDPYTSEGDNTAKLKYPLGYTWLYDVKRADNPGVSEFFIDYKMMDIQRLSRNPSGEMDIHLRLTMVNDWNADEVSLAKGKPMRTAANLKYIDHLQYMLVRRKGRNLNTLFTTVIEPYNKERYIENITAVDIAVAEGSAAPKATDKAAAVKVELCDGRTDYVVYAQNEDVTYTITDGDVSFNFKGFVGVWTLNENGENVYAYANDAEILADIEGIDAELNGTVTGFTKELSLDNYIDVSFDKKAESVELLRDAIIDVEFVGDGNAVYHIRDAELSEDGMSARLHIGNITPIDSYIDDYNLDAGYNYDIAEGRSFRIPLIYEDNHAPVFDEISDNLTTSAGSLFDIEVSATADDGGDITYSARQLPRGASFDAETGTVSWKATASQIGENLFAIDATDSQGRTSTVYFTVTVYGSTTSGGGGGTSGQGSSGAGTDSGSGSTDTDDKTDSGTVSGDNDVPSNDENGTASGDGSGSTDSDVRFIDLDSHAWAEESINALAEAGIIKGTSGRTYSPAANITRADFAILLVRAFELESENSENFADVLSTDYFAAELAVARNTGIVNGIGDNKYAPRNTITRQDMMTIVYRALSENENLVGAIHESPADLSQYPDFASVAEYAKEAVAALISAGLVNGKSGKIAPTDYTTRAEVAVLLKRILDYIAE